MAAIHSALPLHMRKCMMASDWFGENSDSLCHCHTTVAIDTSLLYNYNYANKILLVVICTQKRKCQDIPSLPQQVILPTHSAIPCFIEHSVHLF